MIDSRASEILNYINQVCQDGTYKIVSLNELIDAVSSVYNIDGDGVRHSLTYLAEREYISIKYEDEVEFCLCPLPKGRLHFETQIESIAENKQEHKSIVIASFLGGLIGSTVASIIAFIIYFLVGG